MLINIGFSYVNWKSGVKTPFIWDSERVPHIMLSGVTGGGKTVLSQIVVNQLLTQKKDIAICDFKAGGDWDNIVPEYAEYIACDNILNNFYDSFVTTINEKCHREKYLIFDEFSSYALSKDAKEFKEVMSKISHIAFMGRSFGYHLIFVSQQFNAKILDTAIREQFAIKVYMGSTISTESATMLFPNCDIDKSIHLPRYCGYISLPEKELDIIQLPVINQPHRLKRLLMMKGATYYN